MKSAQQNIRIPLFPVGAAITVYRAADFDLETGDGTLAELTGRQGEPLTNPYLVTTAGEYFHVADHGIYHIKISAAGWNNDVPAWLYSVLHYDSVRDEALQDSKAPKESPSFTGDFTYNKEGDTFDLRMGSFGEHSLELSMAHITSPEDYDSGVFVSYGDVLLKRLGNTLISLQNMGLLFPEGFFSLGDMTLIDGAKIINLLAVNPKEVQQTTITTAVTSLDASLGHIDIYYAGNTNISIDGVINIPTGATAFLTITLWHLGGVRSISWKASQLESVAPTLAGTSGGYDRLVLTPSKINAGKFFVICVESK